jgi:hypothetical protein
MFVDRLGLKGLFHHPNLKIASICAATHRWHLKLLLEMFWWLGAALSINEGQANGGATFRLDSVFHQVKNEF